MIDYTGNGFYCFTDSLHMCLRSAGLDASVTVGAMCQHWDMLAAQFESLAEAERDFVDAVR